MDGILYSFPGVDNRAPVLDSDVYRFRDQYNQEKELPWDISQKMQNSSDHFPVFADFSTAGIL